MSGWCMRRKRVGHDMSHLAPPLKAAHKFPLRSEIFEQFFVALENLQRALPPSPLGRFRRAGWERLRALPGPRIRAAPYRSLRLSGLAERVTKLDAPNLHAPQQEFARSVLPSCAKSCLALIDGQWSEEQSQLCGLPQAVEVMNLAEAFAAFGAHLKQRSIDDESEYFALASASLARDGLAIYVPPDCCVEVPIQILHLSTLAAHSLTSSRIHLILGARSSLHVAICGARTCPWTSDYLEVTLDEGAQLHIDEYLESSESTYCFRPTRALLKKSATLRFASFTQGSISTWQDIDVRLTGEGSCTELSTTHAVRARNRATTSINVAHLSPGATSEQMVRTVLDDAAKAAFRGKIFVGKGASQTRSYQLNNNLLLSDRAICESQPELEILNDDVKASHGATAGALDDEQLFYLCSRGLSLQAARALLINGFIERGLARIKLNELREISRRTLKDLLEP